MFLEAYVELFLLLLMLVIGDWSFWYFDWQPY